ncbi:hypothetical protein EV1_033490 [Malus domestica]
MASGATCVQRLDGSRDSAIHTKYRISLRSSSMREPRYPLPRVVLTFIEDDDAPARAPFLGRRERALSFRFLGAARAGVGLYARERAPGTKGTLGPEARRPPTLKRVLGSFCRAGSTMILPQVHLRKPCYDFSFL